jgi:group I intron endonuclease
MTSGIYCLTSPAGKNYVGQAVNIPIRLSVYRNGNCKGQTKLFHALKKYGFHNFKITTLEKCDISDLNAREVFWIKEKDSLKNGYNLTSGGALGYVFSDEAKQRMSLAAKGRKLSTEHREKLSKIKKGRKLSFETRRKMREVSNNTASHAAHRSNNPDWGIQPSTLGKFKVMFQLDHTTYYRGKFTSREEARQWRDHKVNSIKPTI